MDLIRTTRPLKDGAELFGRLRSNSVSLAFGDFITPAGHPELVPYYHFLVLDSERNNVGHVNLRLGKSRHILQSAGHIGFGINEQQRGNRYARQACQALHALASYHYSGVILTADPDNVSSIRTIKGLGASFLDEIRISETDPSYRNGARTKRRYLWEL